MDNEPSVYLDNLPPLSVDLVNADNADEFASVMDESVWRAVKNGGVLALGALGGGKPCGLIAADTTGDAAELIWVYVEPDKRRDYIASTLFCELADMLSESDQFELSGIFCEYPDAGGELRPFFDSLRFEQEALEEKTVGITLDDLRQRGFMVGAAALPQGFTVQPISALSPVHMKQLNALIDKEQANYLGAPVSGATVQPELSLVLYEGSNPIGCVCFVGGDDSDVVLNLLYIGIPSNTNVRMLLQKAGETLCARFDGSTMLKIPIVNNSAQRLADFLLGEDATVCARIMQASFVFE